MSSIHARVITLAPAFFLLLAVQLPAAAQYPWRTPNPEIDRGGAGPFESDDLRLDGARQRHIPEIASEPQDRGESGFPRSAQPGGTVSASQLRHPLSGKAKRMLDKAQRFRERHDYKQEMDCLLQAVQVPGAEPYALSMLGAAHLRAGNLEAAIAALEKAVALLPGDATNYSNLGYALGLAGQIERGEREVRRALSIDPGRPQAHLVLGAILLLGKSQEEEGMMHLRIAQRTIPRARLVVAAYHERKGNRAAAEEEMRLYLVAGGIKSAESR